WIKTGVVLMGSTNLVDFGNLLIKNFNKTAKNQISLNEKEKTLNQLKPFDLSKDMASLNNRPILFSHGAKDNVVPMSHSEEFVTKLTNSTYHGEVEMLTELNRDHHYSRYSILEAVKWFVKHL